MRSTGLGRTVAINDAPVHATIVGPIAENKIVYIAQSQLFFYNSFNLDSLIIFHLLLGLDW